MLFRLKRFIILIFMLSLVVLTGCVKAEVAPHGTPSRLNGILQVHFLDVGQADSTLLVSPSGQAILIDGGNKADGPEIVSYLKSHGVKKLSAIVATHPHEDHIGGLDLVLQNIPTNIVYIPNATSNTKTFKDFMAAVNTSGAKRIQAKAGVSLSLPDLTGLFVAPNNSSYEDLNNYSAVLRVTYGNVSFLFAGDAEDISEAEMLKSGQDLKVNVLKVGHHGSKSSTTSKFLKAVSPQHAIISVESNNDFGHPTQTILDRLAKAGAKVYRTDQLGTIVATTNGESIEFDSSSELESVLESASTPSPVPSNSTSEGSVELSNIDLREEVVTITNSSKTDVNLSGWKLVSEVGNQTYNFPTGTTLTAGGSLKVVSGEKTRVGTDILVWTQSNIWNNSGDPGLLYDTQGNLVSKR